MPLIKLQAIELQRAIETCTLFEGKYYLWQLLEILKTCDWPDLRIQNITRQLHSLIQSINTLHETSPEQVETFRNVVRQVLSHYQELVRETKAGGFGYYFKQTLLSLGGCLIGTITAILGGVTGLVVGLVKDLSQLRLPTGAYFGAVAGTMIGAAIGYRLPDKWFKNPVNHATEYAVRRLKITFDSLFLEVKKETVKLIKDKILQQSFQGDQQRFKDEFWDKPISYHVCAADAGLVLSEKIKGYVGHHVWITFTFPGEKQAIIIEAGEPMPGDYSPNSPQMTQKERAPRQATGKCLVEMLALHEVLSPIYLLNLKPKEMVRPENIKNFFICQWRYKAGIDDCNTYINRLLQAVGEKPMQDIKRFTEKDKPAGLFIRDALAYSSPCP